MRFWFFWWVLVVPLRAVDQPVGWYHLTDYGLKTWAAGFDPVMHYDPVQRYWNGNVYLEAPGNVQAAFNSFGLSNIGVNYFYERYKRTTTNQGWEWVVWHGGVKITNGNNATSALNAQARAGWSEPVPPVECQAEVAQLVASVSYAKSAVVPVSVVGLVLVFGALAGVKYWRRIQGR